jgi:phytoene dehydrogenase-like protein
MVRRGAAPVNAKSLAVRQRCDGQALPSGRFTSEAGRRYKGSAMSGPRVVIVGGGLAGMTLAKELAERGRSVTLVEAAARLGGKAGAERIDGRVVEHGYHVFPGWYRNVRALLAELGIARDLIDLDHFCLLEAGAYPRVHVVRETASARAALANLRCGVLPWRQVLLSYYAAVDLAAQSFSDRRYLDRISVNGFLYSRFYSSEAMAAFQQQSVLQASAIANYELSAMTSQKVLRAWAATPRPLLSIFPRNLHDAFIEPFAARLRQLGVEIRLSGRAERLVAQDGRIAGVRLAAPAAPLATGPEDCYVLATPLEVTRVLADAEVITAEDRAVARDAPPLSHLVKLETAPMAALHVTLDRRLDLPAAHIMLQGSRYALSFIDVAPYWKTGPGATLSVIAADFAPLGGLPATVACERLLAELRRYVPVAREDIVTSDLCANLDAPLFLNTVGSWTYRPGTRTRIPNLYTAGDYCRSEADLTTMESAVGSALATARDLLADFGDRTHPGPRPLKLWPRWQARALKYAAFPLILPFGARNWLRRRWERRR